MRLLPQYLRLLLSANRLDVAAIVCIRLLRSFLPLGVLIVAKQIVDVLEVHLRTSAPVHWERLAQLLLLEVALVVGGDVLTRLSSLLETLYADAVDTRLTIQVLSHATQLDLAHFEDATTHNTLQQVTDSSAAKSGLFLTLIGLTQSLAIFVSLSTAIALHLPWLLVVLFVALYPAFLGEIHFGGVSYSHHLHWIPERRRMAYLRHLIANASSIKEQKLFGLGAYLLGRYSDAAGEFRRANKALAVRRTVVTAFLTSIGTLGYYAGYAWLIYLTASEFNGPRGAFTLSVFIFVAGAFRQSRDQFQQTLRHIAIAFEQSLHVSRLLSFLKTQSRVVNARQPQPLPAPILEGIVLEDVGFRYPGSMVWAVRHLSFRIRPGESVALVGHNGAGKSTIAKLIGRLYDPEEGRITLDGVPLKAYDLDALRQNIAVVFQDFVRYEFLLRENIGVGEVSRIDDTDQVRRAAQRGLADSVADSLQHGLEQQLGKAFAGGAELSGGEWQKVAVSRAYMRAPQILILDEPTAALDARAEQDVFGRVVALAHDKMTLVISHRFSTVRVADRILVVSKGKVIEEGSHEYLLTLNGEYAALFRLQAAGYQ